MTDLWTMAGEEAEREAAEHHLALARVACACYWPLLARAASKDEYDHAKALIAEGVTTAVAAVATSPADQAILASRVLDSFDEDWATHQAARTAVVEDAPAYGQQMGFAFPAEPLPNEAPELENEIAAWEGADQQSRVNSGNGIGVADETSGPNVAGPGANPGQPPVLQAKLLHASALDIEAGLEPGDYRLDAFGALVLVEAERPFEAVRHTAPGGGEHAPYYIREEGGKFKVVNRNGEVKGTHDTKEQARQQQKALYVNVPGATEEAEKRHGHTPKAVSEKGKKASLQLTALQRQAVEVARKLVDDMPAGVAHHAVAKAMWMRAKGFELSEDETDLVINAALVRCSERLHQAASERAPLHHLTYTGPYAGRPLCGDRRPGDSASHAAYTPDFMFQPGATAPSSGLKVCPACQNLWNEADQPQSQGEQQNLFESSRHTADGVSTEKRDRAEEAGHTLPGTDKFPIENKSDLEKAKHDIGRTNEPHDKVVRYINERAEELGGEKVGEDKKASRVARLWSRVTGRQVEAQGNAPAMMPGQMNNPMNPSSVANPFSPAQDTNAAMTDTNPTMSGMAAGAGGIMSPGTAPPDEIPGQTVPGSATAASSKPRTKPSSNPNAPNQPRPAGGPVGVSPMMAQPGLGQVMTGPAMMAARVAVAETILADNPTLSEDLALHLAAKTIERYPHLVHEAYGGADYPFDDGDRTYEVCSQCGVPAFDSRTGHCHNCGFVNASAGPTWGPGWDPLSGSTTVRPGPATFPNPGIRSAARDDRPYHYRKCRSCGNQVRVQLGQDFPQDHADFCPEQASFPGRKEREQ